MTGATDRKGNIINPATLVLNAYFAGVIDAGFVKKPLTGVVGAIMVKMEPSPTS